MFHDKELLDAFLKTTNLSIEANEPEESKPQDTRTLEKVGM
jgi:hypothetical protein